MIDEERICTNFPKRITGENDSCKMWKPYRSEYADKICRHCKLWTHEIVKRTENEKKNE